MDVPPPPSVKPAIFITILTLATAIILTASLYLLLRYLHYRTSATTSATATATATANHHSLRRVSPSEKIPNFNSLPILTFNSVTTAASSTSDCAVCLSKFEPNDLLRLLPFCRHVFHLDCIDIWLNGNITCPLCRSPVFNHLDSNSNIASSRSFRVEIGSISRRGDNSGDGEATRSRSYSISGSFDYVINDVISEVNVGSFRWPEIKVEDEETERTAALSSEVGESGGSGGGGGWLKEFLISSSRTVSFRGSARWIFTRSSRRSGTELGNRDSESDLEASRLGEEIGELFRWLSTV